MAWNENESTGEEWKGDNYQPEPPFGGEDPDDLLAKLAGIFRDLAEAIDNPQPIDLNGEPPKGSYILDGEIVRKAKNYDEYIEGFKIENRLVAHAIIKDGCTVSTVFLSMDHNFGTGSPILFETLTTYNGEEYNMQRYPTYEAALTGHREMVEELKQKIATE